MCLKSTVSCFRLRKAPVLAARASRMRCASSLLRSDASEASCLLALVSCMRIESVTRVQVLRYQG